MLILLPNKLDKSEGNKLLPNFNYFVLIFSFLYFTQAGHNFEDSYEAITFNHLLGSVDSEFEVDEEPQIKTATCSHDKVGYEGHNHTKEFDGSVEWNYCPSVTEVKNQGKCASDWVSF